MPENKVENKIASPPPPMMRAAPIEFPVAALAFLSSFFLVLNKIPRIDVIRQTRAPSIHRPLSPSLYRSTSIDRPHSKLPPSTSEEEAGEEKDGALVDPGLRPKMRRCTEQQLGLRTF